MNFQFHARNEAIVNYIRIITEQYDLKEMGVVISPQFSVKIITNVFDEELMKYKFIFLSKKPFNCTNEKQYDEYLNEKRGDLVIGLGKDDGKELVESSMGYVSNGEINLLWEKIINQFKKDFLKGAYVVSPNGMKGYYPNHRYSIGAKEAFDSGVIIKPVAGWNHYELKEQD